MSTVPRTISVNTFMHAYMDCCKNDARFCFILGAGASRESGIRTGVEMARIWSEEIHQMYPEPEERQAIMDTVGAADLTPTSRNYFGIYDVRFYPAYENGHAYIERSMRNAEPSIGYYPLSRILTGTRNNLVITTNFDSMVEDALFIYSDKKPQVIGHELLTDYIDMNTDRPIVAKIHRGLFFGPFNRERELQQLADSWQYILRTAMHLYTPIVIGYAGGDHTLMDFLKNPALRLPHGIYWCYRKGEPPSEEVIQLVLEKNGYFIEIEGFDSFMFHFLDRFHYEHPRELIWRAAEARIELHEKKYREFSEKLRRERMPGEAPSDALALLESIESKEAKDLQEALAEDPEDTTLLMSSAYLLSRQQKYTEALSVLGEVLRLEPRNIHAWRERGDVHQKQQAYPAAIADYTQLIELAPMDDSAFANRGYCQHCIGQYQKALADYNHAIAMDAGCATYYNNRAYVYMDLHQYDHARADLQTALDLTPNSASIHDSLGELALAEGSAEEALAHFNQAIELDDLFEEAYRHRAKAYEALGETEKAEADRESADGLKIYWESE